MKTSSPEFELINEAFTDNIGQVFSKSCQIKWKGRHLRMGVYDFQELYQSIKEGFPVNVSNAMVYNFSLEQYRKDMNLQESSLLELKTLWPLIHGFTPIMVSL